MSAANDMRRETLERWPEPPTGPLEALRHAVAMYEGEPDDREVLEATVGMYGEGVRTGLTMGDLRRLEATVLRASSERLLGLRKTHTYDWTWGTLCALLNAFADEADPDAPEVYDAEVSARPDGWVLAIRDREGRQLLEETIAPPHQEFAPSSFRHAMIHYGYLVLSSEIFKDAAWGGWTPVPGDDDHYTTRCTLHEEGLNRG